MSLRGVLVANSKKFSSQFFENFIYGSVYKISKKSVKISRGRFHESKKIILAKQCALEGQAGKKRSGPPGSRACGAPPSAARCVFFPPALQERIASPKLFFYFHETWKGNVGRFAANIGGRLRRPSLKRNTFSCFWVVSFCLLSFLLFLPFSFWSW